MVSSTALALGFAFESFLGSNEAIYIAILSVFVFGGLAVGFAIRMQGLRKQSLEIERGYTCDRKIAIDNPQLFAANYKTLEVIAGPNERPGRS